MLIHHLAEAAPDASWRCAVLFEQPHSVIPNDHDAIATELLESYAEVDALDDPQSHLQTVQWPCSWVATITTPATQAPTQAALIDGLRSLPRRYQVRAVVFFDGEDEGPAFRWWMPALSEAIESYRWSGVLTGKVLTACLTKERTGMPLQSNAQLRGVVAWMLHLSQQPRGERFHTGTFEVISADNAERSRMGFEGGCIVSALAGNVRGPDAAKRCLASDAGSLWFHVVPMDPPSFSVGFDTLV